MFNVNKRRILFLVFILTIFIGINMYIYNFYVLPNMELLAKKKAQFDVANDKLQKLLLDKSKIQDIQKETQKLNTQLENMDKLIPYGIDTPQLVYDFYNYCIKCGVKGGTISFQLDESQSQVDKNTSDKKAAGDKPPEKTKKFGKLEITLTISGNKKNIFDFLYNVNDITGRRINVKSIRLSHEGSQINKSLQDQNTDILYGEIIFYHYIQIDDKQVQNLKQYEFFDNTVGFDTIPDMFK